MAYYGSLCLGIIFAGPTRLLKCASTQTRRPDDGVDDFFVEEDFDENNVVLFFRAGEATESVRKYSSIQTGGSAAGPRSGTGIIQ